MRHTHWRGCLEWKSAGFQFSTTSDEAVKLYDASVSQLMGMYDEPAVGGFEATLKGLMKADPHWVMGHAMVSGLELLSKSSSESESLQKHIDTMVSLAEGPKVTQSEKLHVRACQAYADRDLDKACDIWDSILMSNPLDLWALRCIYTMYIYLGYSNQLRDIVARVLPYWNDKIPNYGYLHGLYAFGLNETNLFDQAAKSAKRALVVNEKDVWATHSLAHVYEMTGQSKQGITFMQSTENDWMTGGMLACHNYWHLALYHIEQGHYDDALGIFDTELIGRAKASQSAFTMTDVSSLLFRLRLEDIDVGKRWSKVLEVASPHLEGDAAAFNHPHLMFACIGSEDEDSRKKLLSSMERFIREGKGTIHRITRDVSMTVCQSLEAYRENNYAQAVDLLFPIRYKMWQLGGSHAQRDVLNLFLIHCAMKSEKDYHQQFARQLLFERSTMKEESPMIERLTSRLVHSH